MAKENKKQVRDIKAPSKYRKVIKFCLVGIAGLILGSGLTTAYFLNSQKKSPLADVAKIYTAIHQNYYQKVSSKTLTNGAINGMISSLNDPFSQVLQGTEAKEVNQVAKGASFAGIGIQMKLVGQKIFVEAIVPKTPAAKSPIKSGDQIVAVDGHKVKADLSWVSDHVRGKKGTQVVLTMKHQKTIFKVTLTRQKIQQSSVSVSYYNGTAVVAVSQFDVNTSKDLKTTLKQLTHKKTKRLIIDLRNNPGGIMQAALESASYFLPNGAVIMQYRDRTAAKTQIQNDKTLNKGYHVSMKPIILINSQTASAAEIFTAALMENHRATSVGQTSYGKGTVQQVSEQKGIEYKFTIAKWLTPNGTWINHKGIKPTYKVPLSVYEKLPEFESDTDLKPNMMGLDVAILQKYLQALNLLPNHLTGVFDQQTEQAVLKYQQQNGLSQTGQVNQQLRQQLYLSIAEKEAQDDNVLARALSIENQEVQNK